MDSNSYIINSIITNQTILTSILNANNVDGWYIVNFANPTGISNLWQGDIIFKWWVYNIILNKILDSPASISVYNNGVYDTYIKDDMLIQI